MLTDVYDLTGKPQRSSYCDKGRDTASLVERHPLRDLLITPRRGSNRTPYLQDPENPNLEDFWDEKNQTFTFGNAISISAILKGLSEDNAAATSRYPSLLNQYFYALKGEYPLSQNITRNIIVVPDDYDANTQECILRNSLPREKTLLLWRSVAAVLGAEKQLLEAGVKAGDHVAVIDFQDMFVDISMLEIEIEDGYIAPVRQAYRHGMNQEKNEQRYPLHVSAWKTKITDDLQESKVIKASFRDGCNDDLPVWQENDWVLGATKNAKASLVRSNNTASNLADLTHETKFCIICSSHPFSNKLLQQLSYLSNPIFEPEKQSFVSDGAGKYSVRLDNDLPTYYDECDGLYFVAQDEAEEKVIPIPLIPPQKRCKGGKPIIGNEYDGTSLDKETDIAKFMLLLGGGNLRKAPLKELNEKVPKIQRKSQLCLHPTFVPGQGLAHVMVFCSLFNKPVLLDLLKMKPSNETIESLENKIDRSYPADTPPTVANADLWRTIEWSVRRWLDDKIPTDGDWFAKARKPLPDILEALANERDLNKNSEQFIRINIFGTEEEKPHYMPKWLYNQIIDKLCYEYTNNINGNVVKLIAWSYQKRNPKMRFIKADLLQKCKDSLNASGSLQEPYRTARTACANMLSEEEEFWDFTERYRSYIKQKLKDYKIAGRSNKNKLDGVDDWNRVMGIMLMSNNEMLRFENHPHASKVCEEIMLNAMNMLKIYLSDHSKNKRYITPLLKIIFYGLRRRRFEPKPATFMKDAKSIEMFKEIRNSIKERYLFWNDDFKNLDALCGVILDYINGNGKLEGVPDLTDD